MLSKFKITRNEARRINLEFKKVHSTIMRHNKLHLKGLILRYANITRLPSLPTGHF